MTDLPRPVIATASDLLDELVAAGVVEESVALDHLYHADDVARRYVEGALSIESDGTVYHLDGHDEPIEPRDPATAGRPRPRFARIPEQVEPRFGLGDRVWTLHLYRQRLRVPCRVCGGEAKVNVEGSDLRAWCPAEGCRNGSIIDSSETEFASISTGTVGKVEAEIVAPDRDRPGHVKASVHYMLYETGVGSGRIWDEGLLHATREDAQYAARAAGAVDDAGAYTAEEDRARRWY